MLVQFLSFLYIYICIYIYCLPFFLSSVRAWTQTALYILKLIMCASEALPDAFIAGVLPTVLALLQGTEDHSVMAATTDVAAVFVQKSAAQLMAGAAPDGTPWVTVLYQVVGYLLNPEQNEEGSSSVGRLLVQLLMRCNSHLSPELVGNVLHAALIRLEGANNLSMIRGLLLVFSRFINAAGVASSLQLLSSLPAINLTNAKDAPLLSAAAGAFAAAEVAAPAAALPAPVCLLTKWVLNQADLEIMSPYYARISAHALGLLFTPDVLPLLAGVAVQGYPVVEAEHPAMAGRRATRSMGAAAGTHQ
jgi:hypothetical protein